MSSGTVILLVLVIALAVGNALLFFVKRRAKTAAAVAQTGLSGTMGPDHQLQDNLPEMPLQAISSAPLEKKIELAHLRLQALETKVRGMQAAYDGTLKGKVTRLEAFRDTANAEIIALKELLEGMRTGERPVAANQKSSKVDKGISAGEMRRLIYRSSSG